MPIQPIPGFADPFSSLTHLAAAIAALALAPRLVIRGAGDRGRLAALGMFALAVVFTLSMSGIYHLLPAGSTGRHVFRVLDHAAVFTLIAGTFTPVHVIVFRGRWRWGMLAFIWLVAAAAISLKSVFFTGIPDWSGLLMYLAMGWFGVTSGAVLWRRFGWGFVRPLVLGAVAYTAGALVDFLEYPTLIPGVLGPHGLFHVAVLVGIGCHWHFIAGIARTRPVYAPARTDTAARGARRPGRQC